MAPRPMGSRRFGTALATVSILLILLVGAAATALPGPSGRVIAAPRSLPGALQLPPSAVPALHWGQPVPAGAHVPFAALNASNSTGCVPIPSGVILGQFGLNFSVATLPANGSGPAPLNFSWTIHVNGGGLPPYRTLVYISNATTGFNSTVSSGTQVLATAGIWYIYVWAEDSTCTQFASSAFEVHAWGALGPNPVVVAASAIHGAAPLAVSYSVNVSLLPANWTVTWLNVGLYPYAPVENFTYYLPGTYTATACFVEPNDEVYDCASSPTVTVTGPSPVATNVTVGAGPYPTNVTFNVSVVNASALPAPVELYLYAWDGLWGNWSYSNTSSVNLTESLGCGHPWTSFVSPSTGNCSFYAHYALLSPTFPSNTTDDGYFGFGIIEVNLTGNGSPTNWAPTASYSYGPTSGAAPLNVTLNFSASGGLPPYHWDYALFGNETNATNSTQLVAWGAGNGWNGSQLSFVWDLNTTGYYWATVFVSDAADNWVAFSLPLINVGNVTIPAPPKPLALQATDSVPTAWGPGAAAVAFLADFSGGTGPYTIQWSFGDGTYGASTNGTTIDHVYGAPGTYDPFVRVTDGAGHTIVEQLHPVVVPTPPPVVTIGTNGGSPAPAVNVPWVLGSAAVAGAFICLAILFARREVRREGEALVSDLAPETSGPAPDERR